MAASTTLAAVAQYLRELHAIVPSPYRHQDAISVVQDLKRVVLNEVPNDEFGARSLSSSLSLLHLLSLRSLRIHPFLNIYKFFMCTYIVYFLGFL